MSLLRTEGMMKPSPTVRGSGSGRILVSAAGTDWRNGSQRAEPQFDVAKPSVEALLLRKETSSIYRFYTTVTEPADFELTAQQKSQRYFDGYLSSSVASRF